MMQQYQLNSYLFGGNAPYVEELYESYLDNPGSVPERWREYFDQMQHVPAADGSAAPDVAHAPIVESFAQRAKEHRLTPPNAAADGLARKQVYVQQIIAGYRYLGCRWANLDPLKRQERPQVPELEPAFYDFAEGDMATIYPASNTYFGFEQASLRDIVGALRETYCGSIGAEFMHISDPNQKRWLQERLESTRTTPNFSAEEKKHILERLTAAEGLERYLATKYVGQKRFSLEGGESFIASMDEIIQRAGAQGVQEIIIGMAHRGRLNVLVNVLGKMPRDLFAEFEGGGSEDLQAGDVKYHKGFSSDVSTPGGPVHLSLAFNPSHLEISDPVVEGSCKARMERRGDTNGSQVLPLLVHGDAAFAGQGVVMETLNLALTRGYGTHGTVHIVINNQIGFTTSDVRDSRSTLYCTDVVKMIEAPVLHVNGDDPEAVVFATQIAVDYRKQFRRDVVVDIVCFRKLGHNEQDTPALTQPLMYKKIAQHPGTRKLYADKLTLQGVLKAEEPEGFVNAYRTAMDEGRLTVDPVLSNFKSKYAVDWVPFLNRKWTDSADTAVPITELKRLGQRITTIPANFKLHPLVEKVIADRAAMAEGKHALDWGMGEHLAYASLVASGYGVRLTGQDSGRGTFTHRHAVLHDQNRERFDAGIYVPLGNVSESQAPFRVIDSVLSEEAVLAFEYGYSTAEPNTLVVWEAQFGDFVNGAQVVIDQFIVSGEVKWGRASGLTLLLPHGYEGQGPEHSSARPERFLQLCADNNIQVCQPTTPAQIFHLLRRQMIRLFRKPLVILSPKSLLRHKEAVSDLTELSKGAFQTVIGETSALDAKKVKRVIACSGKIYYDLRAARGDRDDVAIVRLEQLYPFPHKGVLARAQEIPASDRVDVGTGRAAESGCVVPDPAQSPGEPGRVPASRVLRPAALGVSRRRLLLQAHRTAKGADCRRVRACQRDGSRQIKRDPGTAVPGRLRPRLPHPRTTPRKKRSTSWHWSKSRFPRLSESVAEATLLQWKKKPGDAIARDEILIEIETDKVVLEVPAPSAGVLSAIVKESGSTVASDELIATIDTAAGASTAPAAPAPAAAAAPAAAPVAAAPAAPADGASADAGGGQDHGRPERQSGRRYRHRQGRPHHQGRRARRTRRARHPSTGPRAGGSARSAAASLQEVKAPLNTEALLQGRTEQRVPMSRLRQRIAERLIQSQSTAAILTTFNEVNMQPVIDLRNKFKDRFEKEHGVKLGFMSFFVKAAVAALKKYPVVNASVDGTDIVYHGYFDIGIAVSSPRGLVVPILRNADQMTFAEIERAIGDYGVKARDGKLSIEDLTGGTFSISNGGTFGSMLSTPIINRRSQPFWVCTPPRTAPWSKTARSWCVR